MSAVWVLIALVAAAAASYGLTRFADRVLLTKGGECRLEGDR
jgi:hypothetical protein